MKLSITFFFAIVAGAFSLTSCDSPAESGTPKVASAQQATPAPAAASIAVTARQYDADYKANEVAADEKYKGKTIKISGTVESIEKDISDNPYVTLSTGADFDMGITCSFEEAGAVRNLRKGQKITIIGTGSGMTMQIPSLDECKIVQ